MKFAAKLRNSLLAATMVFVPLAAQAAGTVSIEGRTAVANVTAGDTVYTKSVNAKTDEVVKVQIWYHNREDANSNKVADNLKVGINLPTTAGKSQAIKGTISADNSNTVVDTANVNLALDKSRLELVTGSATWRHNTGSNDAPNWVTENLSAAQEQQLVNGGVVLENEKPCFNFEANVTILARVKTDSVSITKKVRLAGETDWKVENTAKAGDTLEYLITFANEGNTELKQVVVADNLPAYTTLVPGTTMIKNGANPNGTKVNSDNITNGGIIVGDYAPGTNAFVWFKVKIASNLKPGDYTFKNVGIVKPQGMGEYFNTAITTVSVKGTTPTITPKPVTPVIPVTPAKPSTPLPDTGVEGAAAGLMGTGGLTYAAYFYRKSKKSLASALRNIVK